MMLWPRLEQFRCHLRRRLLRRNVWRLLRGGWRLLQCNGWRRLRLGRQGGRLMRGGWRAAAAEQMGPFGCCGSARQTMAGDGYAGCPLRRPSGGKGRIAPVGAACMHRSNTVFMSPSSAAQPQRPPL